MGRVLALSTKTEVPSLWDLMSDGLRWSWFNNNRNKVHNKCNALVSSQTIPTPWFMEKLSSTKQVPCSKKVEEHCTRRPRRHHVERKGPLALIPWALSSEMQFRGQSIEIKIHSRKTVFQFPFPSLKFSNPEAAGGDSWTHLILK